MRYLKSLFGDRQFLKSFFKLVLPVMLASLLVNIVNFADNIMVGAYSNEAVSAVYAVNQMTFVFNILIFGVVGGAGIFIQQFFGSGDQTHLRQAFHFKIYAVLTLCAIAFPLLFIFKEELIELFLTADVMKDAILELSVDYFDIAIFSFIPFIFTVILSSTLREVGKTVPPVFSALVSLAVNIAINALLIDGVVSWGVQGAAIATVLARTMEMLTLLLVVAIKKYSFARDFWHSFSISGALVKQIALTSLPVALNELLWSLSMVVMSALYSKTGNVLSALSITNTASEIFNIIFVGFASGIGVFVGHKLGDGKIKEARENAGKLLTLAFITGLISAVILFGLAFILPLFYAKVTPEQKELATKLIVIYGAAVPLFAINTTVSNIYKAGGRTAIALSVDGLTNWCLSVLSSFLLVQFTSWPLEMIYLLVYSLDLLKVAITLPLYFKKDLWSRDLVQSY